MKNTKKVFLLSTILLSFTLFTTSCMQNVSTTPKTSGNGWEKIGSLSQGDLLDIKLFTNQAPYRYLAYRTEPTFIEDFQRLLLMDNYSQTFIQKTILCYNSLAWRLNDSGLNPNVKAAMNDGQYKVTVLIAMDTNGRIVQLLINKKSIGSFYTASMYYNNGNWYDITNQLQ